MDNREEKSCAKSVAWRESGQITPLGFAATIDTAAADASMAAAMNERSSVD
jgi:hypothetical protein